MSQPSKYPNSIQDDDRLADFTDQILDGKLNQTESNVDENLLGLEETILRLNHFLPSAPLSQAAVKQMQVRLNARIRREGTQAKQPFWKKWLAPQFRPQLGMAFAVITLLIIFAIFLPSFNNTGGSPVTATALAPTKNGFIIGILAGIILIFLWIKRPK